MSAETINYPGDLATPEQICLLAEEYRKAAHKLLELGRPKQPLSLAPFRLSAIHAIELYLNVFLMRKGIGSNSIRGMQHNLKARTDLAKENGLILKSRTLAHLHALADTREYLVTRYGPELCSSVSQINRLVATLEEVATKVASTNK